MEDHINDVKRIICWLENAVTNYERIGTRSEEYGDAAWGDGWLAVAYEQLTELMEEMRAMEATDGLAEMLDHHFGGRD